VSRRISRRAAALAPSIDSSSVAVAREAGLPEPAVHEGVLAEPEDQGEERRRDELAKARALTGTRRAPPGEGHRDAVGARPPP